MTEPMNVAARRNDDEGALRQGTAPGAQITDLEDEQITDLEDDAYSLLREIKELGGVSFSDVSRGINLDREVRRFEVKLILRALQKTEGHQTRAARFLGMNVTTLNSKIKRYGIDPHGNI